MAKDLYALAYKSIEARLKEIHAERAKSGARLQENEQFRQLKEHLYGNIPVYVRQAMILESLSKLETNENLLSEVYEELSTFFQDVIHPTNKTISNLGFVEELEWTFIKRKILKYSLGFFLNEPQDRILRICLR